MPCNKKPTKTNNHVSLLFNVFMSPAVIISTILLECEGTSGSYNDNFRLNYFLLKVLYF